MKKFIAGLLVGVLLTAGITVGAQAVKQYTAKEVNYPILINGKAFKADKPIVGINGSTYMPLAVIGNALGVKVSWNGDKKQIEIGETLKTNSQKKDTDDYSDWVPYTTSDLELLTENILNGNVVYFNGQYLASPEYVKSIENAQNTDIEIPERSNALTPDAEIVIVDDNNN